MKKVLITVLVVFGLGVVLGRLFVGPPPRAEAGGENPLSPCQDINGDGKSDVTDAIFFLQWHFLGGPEPACPVNNDKPVGLPDTGQTKCYDRGGLEIPCEGATCPGQDGAYATGCPSEGRFVDNQDGTVTDTCTGLMWQKDTADTNGDGQSSLQDSLPWCRALAYCENLIFAGHDDWRLPNVRELQSIVDYEGGFGPPAIDPVFGALSSLYSSSTSYAGGPVGAWNVGFGGVHMYVISSNTTGYHDNSSGGGVYVVQEGHGSYVRAVRSVP